MSSLTKKVKTVLLFHNGNIAAFDENDNQIPELQKHSAIDLFTAYAVSKGYDVEGCEVRCSNYTYTIKSQETSIK